MPHLILLCRAGGSPGVACEPGKQPIEEDLALIKERTGNSGNVTRGSDRRPPATVREPVERRRA